MLQKKFDELKLTGCLPSPSGVGLAVLQQTQNEDYTLAELSRTLAADPVLTGRILRLANSSANTGVEVARTAHQAALRLGVRTVRNVALGFTLVSGHRGGSCRNFDYEHYWSHSLAIAVAAQVLAARMPRMVPSEAFTFGLLSGIGRLALASIHPSAYASVLTQVRDGDPLRLAQLEREAFGLDHGELGAAMFEDWHLPMEYAVAVLACAESPTERESNPAADRLVSVFHGARSLADALMTTDEDAPGLCRSRHERLAALRSSFGIGLEEFGQMWTQVASDWNDWGKLMNIDASTTTTPARLELLARRADRLSETNLTPGLDLSATKIGLSAPKAVAAAAGAPTAATPAAAAPAAPSTPTLALPGRISMRVLVVEDDPVARKLICFHLAKEGHSVISAANGREGLKLAFEHYPHLVVTDWMMPEMDGIELVRALRRSEEGQFLQIILLTGREDEARVVEAFEAGTDEYLVKPLNSRILLARVRSAQRVVALSQQVRADAEDRNRQVAEMAVLNRKLQLAALTDPLTELPNRRQAIDRLEQELATSLRDGLPLSAIMIDIDRFKTINDQYGHDTGDAVLKEVAQILRACLRSTELVCRVGGEEFLVLCPRSNTAKAALIAERMRQACESTVIRHGRFQGAVTLSLGVAELDRGSPSVDRMLKTADERTYLAKRAGRNRVVAEDGTGVDLRAAS